MILIISNLNYLRVIFCGVLISVLLAFAFISCAESPDNGQYTIPESAGEIVSEIMALGKSDFMRTTHPDAQWFPDAGLGLFMHWGIHSVQGLQPSWAMIKDYPHGGTEEYQGRKYNALAKDFNPRKYDPDMWIKAASEAGFTYAVLTAKHHDGYALWPTEYGNFGTKQYMNGRDLLKPYVDACRKYGLKVGFYFSPRDWNFPGHEEPFIDFDYNKGHHSSAISDPVKNREQFEKFYAYTVGQLHELLTRYGTIDLLWFDGIGWPGIDDLHVEETLAWVRRLQPGIITNDRWNGVGDFETPEWNMPEKRPESWWENCISWNGHWGYNPEGKFQSNSWVLRRLAVARSWGGNFLLNVGPAPDGTMQAGYYERLNELKEWMAHSRESVIGAQPVRWEEHDDVPITKKDNTWYVHIFPDDGNSVSLKNVSRPDKVYLLRTGSKIQYTFTNNSLSFSVPPNLMTELDNVVAIVWQD